MEAVFIIGIFLCFFLSLLLVTKKPKSLPDKVLGVWLVIIGVHLGGYFLFYQGFWDKYPHLVGVTVPIPLLHGPMLYLYIIYSLRSDVRLRQKDYLHFLPALLGYLYMSVFLFTYSAAEKQMVDKGLVDDFNVFSAILVGAFVVSGLGYTIMSYRKLTGYKQMILANFSFEARINLDWLKYSIWGLGLIFVTVGVVTLLREGVGVAFPFNADLIFYSMIVLFVFCVGFFGIQHRHIFSNKLMHDNEQLVEAKQESEYRKSGLKAEVALKAHSDLLRVMISEKPYLNPSLTLNDLAGMVNVSANHLSQIINQYEQMNFHDFVNKYRVQEFIERARKNSHFSILANALESGFNSKSSFNAVFKKHFEISPSKYLAGEKLTA